MNVLIVGSGGREHALAWKVAQSPRLIELYIAPGNAGTANNQLPITNLPLSVHDTPSLIAVATEKRIDLVLIGPEAPLAAGLADALRAAGRQVFGPSQAAAQIESSKAFAKAFMARHGIPTAPHQSFTDFHAALRYLHTVKHDVVIKASGLAAGKGVIVPDCGNPADCLHDAEAALRTIMLDREFGAAGDEVVIEERLDGEELSVLAFTDGVTVRAMPAAQDHKRIFDGDRGPNTGGMGAYAPAPIATAELMDEITRTILQPAVEGLRAEGRPFVGVLYAGLMLTRDGPRVIEFNCRFGDPETQAILPLLETDLLEIAEACVERKLEERQLKWKSGAAACVVLASEGYPGAHPKDRVITGLGAAHENAFVFHAGTASKDGEVVTAGGRVLGVTGWAETLDAALQNAYRAVAAIHFEGMQYRTDIGWRALQRSG